MTAPAAIGPRDAGLQAERTGLAWSRTSLGVAANAALLSYREFQAVEASLAVVPAALAVVIALATALYGRHRTRALRRSPLPVPLAPRAAVALLGSSVVLLAVLSGVSMMV